MSMHDYKSQECVLTLITKCFTIEALRVRRTTLFIFVVVSVRTELAVKDSSGQGLLSDFRLSVGIYTKLKLSGATHQSSTSKRGLA